MLARTALLSACTWIDNHLEAFTVSAGSSQEQIAELKAVGELAHAADFLRRTHDHQTRAIGERWLAHGLAAIDNGGIHARLLAADRRYLLVATTYVPFHLAGHVHRGLIDLVRQQILDIDMPPFAWQMLVPTLLMLGVAPSHERREDAWRRGVLANRPANLLELPTDIIYLMAHECYYASQWGHVEPPYGHLVVEYVGEMIPRLIAHFAARGHADLLAELLLASHTQGLPCPPQSAWAVLESVQTAAGNLVPPTDPGTAYPRLAHSILGRTYHTTLVGIMAWSACSHSRSLLAATL